VQPKFIANRDVFEAREKKAKLYSWKAFILGEIVSLETEPRATARSLTLSSPLQTAEIPYLFVCGFLYWATWYATVGFSFRADIAGPVFLQVRRPEHGSKKALYRD
jgi:ATP-binding cassette subfamily G (WHITE) protein 2 (SNQ2)